MDENASWSICSAFVQKLLLWETWDYRDYFYLVFLGLNIYED